MLDGGSTENYQKRVLKIRLKGMQNQEERLDMAALGKLFLLDSTAVVVAK
jgi:hypothetical protein